ncbi:hypothetical protein C5749_06110 [Sphingobacterium gobiense]|uniref:Uncharacterized protein n=1 Tax=Sphingobacterium gobiense TaxID=1382456 RepID=A0A2S9JU26_9SPHI|nr:hypothetical protein C5749_06110 [Sphingobacterium gobiense]
MARVIIEVNSDGIRHCNSDLFAGLNAKGEVFGIVELLPVAGIAKVSDLPQELFDICHGVLRKRLDG